MSDAGIFRGAYHFFWLLTPWQDQAENFIKTVGALTYLLFWISGRPFPKAAHPKRDAWKDVPADQRLSIIRN
jgi:GH25 family lysozyme M1 (1,4-beta-N-acetylmuramidase)